MTYSFCVRLDRASPPRAKQAEIYKINKISRAKRAGEKISQIYRFLPKARRNIHREQSKRKSVLSVLSVWPIVSVRHRAREAPDKCGQPRTNADIWDTFFPCPRFWPYIIFRSKTGGESFLWKSVEIRGNLWKTEENHGRFLPFRSFGLILYAQTSPICHVTLACYYLLLFVTICENTFTF